MNWQIRCGPPDEAGRNISRAALNRALRAGPLQPKNALAPADWPRDLGAQLLAQSLGALDWGRGDIPDDGQARPSHVGTVELLGEPRRSVTHEVRVEGAGDV